MTNIARFLFFKLNTRDFTYVVYRIFGLLKRQILLLIITKVFRCISLKTFLMD
jgi:hypothetical protein